jgi:hypothetical protein
MGYVEVARKNLGIKDLEKLIQLEDKDTNY